MHALHSQLRLPHSQVRMNPEAYLTMIFISNIAEQNRRVPLRGQITDARNKFKSAN